jgi:hypothetical protein
MASGSQAAVLQERGGPRGVHHLMSLSLGQGTHVWILDLSTASSTLCALRQVAPSLGGQSPGEAQVGSLTAGEDRAGQGGGGEGVLVIGPLVGERMAVR